MWYQFQPSVKQHEKIKMKTNYPTTTLKIERFIQTLSNRRSKLNSSGVPSAPHNVHHPVDVLSGIGTIYEVK